VTVGRVEAVERLRSRALRPRLVAPTATAVAVMFLVASLLVGVAVGPVHIGFLDVVQSALARIHFPGVESGLPSTQETIVWELRFPRVILAAIVGGTLAVAGASYQGVFRNPLADPYLLGVGAGAGLGATLGVVYTGSGQAIPLCAFAGGVLAVAVAYSIGRAASPRSSGATLLLAGVTVATFFTAVQTFVQQQHADALQQVYSWILGGLPNTGWSDVRLVLPYVAVCWAGILVHRRLLDVLSLGDEEAASLGVNVRRVRFIVTALATVGTAAVVAVSGLIGFVGIIVPHAIRLLVGPSYRLLVPLSVICGAGFLVLADVVARTALAPAEIPIGVVTAFCGAPFFAVVLRTSRRMIG
jgi:iron complex transport system permease protein